ncbi:MAG TPA: hypothetical protein VEZ20_15505 [Allosphingosinicella sp.]|jgi:hypothetical protein|nr:hypothetical protein [Allosphingosinicella sp.]
MAANALTTFAAAMRSDWAPGTAPVAACRERLERLLQAEPSEDWLASLLAERPASRELYRDPEHGFMFLAHSENEGLYRPPHDHGRAWVVYGVQSGALEVRTWQKVPSPGGAPRLVLSDTHVLAAGEARAYLPGEIHDTRCLTETALLFRFTERDLRQEDQVERKLTRFVERDGHWTVPAQ